MNKPAERWVEVGNVGRAHGVRGELYVRLHNTQSELVAPGQQFRAQLGGKGESANQPPRVLEVERARWTAKGWLVKFSGVDQREVAAALTTCKLFVRRGEFPKLGDDEFYLEDLIGMAVGDAAGRTLGRVRGFFDNGAHEVCVIETDGGTEALVPFVGETLVDVLVDERRVVMDVPPGIPGLADDGPQSAGET